MTIRLTYRNDEETDIRDGEVFAIIGFTVEEVGGDHPEGRFVIRFADGASREGVNPECLFTGYDKVFDKWCQSFPPDSIRLPFGV